MLLRHAMPAEEIVFFANEGNCRYCRTEDQQPGTVKMARRSDTLELDPNRCRCLLCGQLYFVDVGDDIWQWQLEQARQKEGTDGSSADCH